MKLHRSAAALTAALAAALWLLPAWGAASAKTLEYPPEDPAFVLTFPEDWTTSVSDNSLQAAPADKSVAFAVAELEDADDLKSGSAEGVDLLVKTGKIKEMQKTAESDTEAGGIKWHTIEGSAKDKEGAEVRVRVATFTFDGDSIFWLYSFAPPPAVKTHEKELKDITASIKKK